MAEDMVAQAIASAGGINLGFWAAAGVILFLIFLFIVGIAALIFIATKKNWLIWKWQFGIIFLKPSGSTFRPFIDKAAIIHEGSATRWKFKDAKFNITPPGREYVMPGDWVFFWSGSYREAIPLLPSVAGFMGQATPQRKEKLIADIRAIQELATKDIDSIKKTRASDETPGKTSIGEEITEFDYVERANSKIQELQVDFANEVRGYSLALEPKVDTGIMNSMFAEGEKAIREHKMPDNWTTYIALIMTLVIVVVSLMLSAASAMSNAEAVGKQSSANNALAVSMHELAMVNNATINKLNLPMQISGG